MIVSPNEAAETLGEIDRTARRSAQAHGYANASPSFMLLGLMWMIGYAGSDLIPTLTRSYRGIGWLWLGLVILGVAANTYIGRRQYMAQYPGQKVKGRGIGLRWVATLVATWIFIAATFAIMRPVNPAASAAFVPLIAALAYAVFGIWRGLRFLYAGVVVAALTLGGWFYLPQHFLLWMAAVGGGSLILVGLWLKKV
jgi:hypothetical protein